MPSRYLESVVLGEDRSPLSWLIRVLLWPLSVVYRIGLWLFLLPYKLGIRKRCMLKAPVVSVGNLTFGGTGKTPAVQTICRLLAQQGLRVAILSRGHGGSASGTTVVSDGNTILATSAEAGDEPVLLARTLRGVPVIAGKDRRVSGKLACQRFAPDVILLDDGLQYWQLHRDLDVVVLDSRKPFGSGFVMPMGDLREPISGLRRAGAILLVGPSDSQLIERLQRLAPDAPIFGCARKPVCFRNAAIGEEHDLDWVRGRGVFAFCGIGRPESFFDMLGSLGASVAGRKIFPDHHRLSKTEITAIIDGARACGADVIITTEKDLARLDGESIANMHALAIDLEIKDCALFCGNASRSDTLGLQEAEFPQHSEKDTLSFAQHIANRIDRKNKPASG